MSRQHTYTDRAFGTSDYDPDDYGEFEKDLVFVIMPFEGDEMACSYRAIGEACSELGLRVQRADEVAGSGIVLRDIAELIERAEFIICDLTLERPNVYYELGYAHGVGNEAPDVLLVASTGTELHFDVAPMRVRYYSSTEELHGVVVASLRAMMKATRQ